MPPNKKRRTPKVSVPPAHPQRIPGPGALMCHVPSAQPESFGHTPIMSYAPLSHLTPWGGNGRGCGSRHGEGRGVRRNDRPDIDVVLSRCSRRNPFFAPDAASLIFADVTTGVTRPIILRSTRKILRSTSSSYAIERTPESGRSCDRSIIFMLHHECHPSGSSGG